MPMGELLLCHDCLPLTLDSSLNLNRSLSLNPRQVLVEEQSGGPRESMPRL
jgi:hypothetical protein